MDERGAIRFDRSLALWGAGIFLLGFLTRGLWAAFVSAPPDGSRLDDSVIYHAAAASIADGNGYVSPWSGMETALFPPGYPFFLSILYKVFGLNFQHGEVANVVLGALTCVAVLLLGTILFSPKVGIVSGLVLAVYPNQVLFVPVILSEVLFTFLLVTVLLVAVWVGRRPQMGVLPVLGVGALVGVSALVRTEANMLLLIVPVFWLVTLASRPRALRSAALFVLAAVLVILPWSVRNYIVMDSPIFISSNIGANFFRARWTDRADVIAAVEESLAPYQDLSAKEFEVKRNEVGMREGLKLFVTKPWREVLMAPDKFKSLYASDTDAIRHIETPSDASGAVGTLGEPLRSILRHLSNGVYFAVLALAIGGAAVALVRKQVGAVLIVSLILIWTVGQMIMIPSTRYHFPIIPAFCLLAGLAAVAAFDAVRAYLRRQPRTEGDSVAVPERAPSPGTR